MNSIHVHCLSFKISQSFQLLWCLKLSYSHMLVTDVPFSIKLWKFVSSQIPFPQHCILSICASELTLEHAISLLTASAIYHRTKAHMFCIIYLVLELESLSTKRTLTLDSIFCVTVSSLHPPSSLSTMSISAAVCYITNQTHETQSRPSIAAPSPTSSPCAGSMDSRWLSLYRAGLVYNCLCHPYTKADSQS